MVFLKLNLTIYFLDTSSENENYNSFGATGSHTVSPGKWFHGTTEIIV